MLKAMMTAAVAAVLAISGTAMAAGPAGGAKKGFDRTPKEVTGMVNINTASASELEKLPGVGRYTASLIVAHREKTPFKAPNDILKVKGVGPGIFRRIKQHLAVSGPTTLTVLSKGKSAPAATPLPKKADASRPAG